MLVERWIESLHRRGRAPRMSATERQALEAGDTWLEEGLFSGRPDLAAALAEPYPGLTSDEQAFLDGPVEEVCRRVDDWRLLQTRELPEGVWEFLRSEGFFGLTLPAAWGGKGFSQLAASAVFGKLASASPSLSTLVLLPNSVGPGELLLHYGTDEQRRRYLPRLARGEEIPCFALTEAGAGSDAAALASRGVVFGGGGGGPRLRLTWSKRYITLAPIATLLGLAVKLEDPEGLLGGGPEPGITVVLVPTDLPGVEIGRHHDPLGLPFPNGPTSGRDVVVPLEQVIGGAAGVGRGWRMLMETLSGGRAISLPSQAAAGVKGVARVAGAYAAVRRQFGRPLARFEGIEEPLARLASAAWQAEAARVFTCGAVDAGRRPAVISALVKRELTEMARRAAQDGMDVLGGAGICLGPRNLLGRAHFAAPIGITVEGANILTRTLIVFGQGAMRSHPWAGKISGAIERRDAAALRRAAAGQLFGLLRNLLRLARLEASRGRLARGVGRGRTAIWGRRLGWAATRFAVLADLALLALGGSLKRRGKLTGRFADALAGYYLGVASLRRYAAEGRQPEDRPLVDHALAECLDRMQRALDGVAAEFPGALPGALVRGPLAWWLRVNRLARPPGDHQGRRAATVISRPGAVRDRLTAGLFTLPAGRELEEAFTLAAEAEPLERRLREAVRRGELEPEPSVTLVDRAAEARLLDPLERELLAHAAAARDRAIQVDDFDAEEWRHGSPASASEASTMRP